MKDSEVGELWKLHQRGHELERGIEWLDKDECKWCRLILKLIEERGIRTSREAKDCLRDFDIPYDEYLKAKETSDER